MKLYRTTDAHKIRTRSVFALDSARTAHPFGRKEKPLRLLVALLLFRPPIISSSPSATVTDVCTCRLLKVGEAVTPVVVGQEPLDSIDDALAEEVREFHKANNRDATGRIFKSSVGAFRMAVKESGIELLPGQLTHVLRHTFASHFMMNGGNILALQKVRGHSSLQTTMIYAHLSPVHLPEAKLMYPLTRLTVG